MRQTIIVVALTLVACSLAASGAAAKRSDGVETRASLSHVRVGPDASARSKFKGTVKSAKGTARARKLCERRRLVRVPGVGTDRTDRRGRFSIRLGELAPADRYRARVRRKVIGAGDGRIACERGRSTRLTVTNLTREAEAVVLGGGDLGGLSGVAPGEVAAFSWNRSRGGWRQVPVQVDERHVVDFRTVHGGSRPYSLDSLEYSDPGTLSGPDPNPVIDGNDELAFMARDAGGRVPAKARDPRGIRRGSGHGVRITDPLDRRAVAWIYLFEHDGRLDPAAGRDYVDYEFDLLAGEYPGDYRFEPDHGDPIGNPPANPTPPTNPEDSRVTTPFYSERFADRWITDEMRITAGAASGVDILDRNRLGAPFVDDDPVICPRTENTFAAGHGAFVANVDGPVRAIRDYIGANSGIYTQRRQVFYERREDLTTFLRVHPLPVGPSDLLDYTSAAIGMRYSNDLMDAPVTIDGVPDAVPTGRLTWELTRGPQGSLVVAHDLDTTIPNFQVTSIYADDATPARLPCTGDPQALGTSGVSIQAGLPRTDPTPRGDPQDQGLPLYRLTSHRTHFYEPPGVTVREAERRSDEARTPLRSRVAPLR